MNWLKVYERILTAPRVWVLLIFGFASGLPFALSDSTLQAWLTTSGVSTVDIGLFGFLTWPAACKFLWSPLMDRFTPPLLDRRRGWMLFTQIALVLLIVLMAFANPEHALVWVAVLALLMSFSSASQDISIDAYRTDLLKRDERGFGSAVFVGGWRLGALVSGGLALIMAEYLGWRNTYLIMAVCMGFCIITSCIAPKATLEQAPPKTLYEAVYQPFKEFLTRRLAVAILIFIVVYKIGDALALSMMSTFLIRGVGFHLATVGSVFKIYGTAAIMAGIFIGGLLLPRLKMFYSLLIFGFLQAASNLMFMWLAIAGKKYVLLAVAVSLDNIAGGMSTAAFVAFLMALCDHRFTATQFALLSALSAIGRSISRPIVGVYVIHYGWASLFGWSFLIGLPGLLLLIVLNKYINFNGASIQAR